MQRVLRLALLPLLLVVCGAGSAGTMAPGLQVTRVQDLTFGSVFPGVVTTVQMTAAQAGQYTITNGTGRAIQAQLIFVLPPVLTAGVSSTMPLSFGSASAGFSPTGSLANVVSFDPRVPFTVTVAAKSSARVFLGGTLQPSIGQSVGSYSAPITLTTI